MTVEGDSLEIIDVDESEHIGKCVDIKDVEGDSLIIIDVFGIKTVEGDSLIIIDAFDISDIVVGGDKGEVEIIVVWINVDINCKSGIEVKIVDSFSISNIVVNEKGSVVSAGDNNSVVDIGKVVVIIYLNFIIKNGNK